MFLMPITPQEIVTITSSLKNSAGGVDGVQTKIIKMSYIKYHSRYIMSLIYLFNKVYSQTY